ncbi:hypothetical protein TD95_004201 [Thielaviopsis punctulata]|uniref:Septin-type G domain-containing protein n=1 Tax=Thielaviopsis punctulata TaxID=72032 RepID=A0A0F4ZCP7_9PEZI|nr:hypothetical protein TD95_004201 [Thielaviopsis punctulata]
MSSRQSFSMLLRRSKSSELKGKKAREIQEQLQKQHAIPKMPPKLPEFNKEGEQLSQAFGSDQLSEAPSITPGPREPYSDRPSMDPGHGYIATSPPPPPIPAAVASVDPYARTESMTNRGRYSYASTTTTPLSNPRRLRRRKDPTPFNALIIGTKNSGKTSFLEFLKTALALPAKKRSRKADEEETVYRAPQGHFIPHFVETEIDNERIGLTLWDSEGLEKNVVDLQLREMLAFLESKFEDTFTEEMKVIRSPGVQDTHIHAVFLVLDPARLDRNMAATRSAANGAGNKYMQNSTGILDNDLDLQVMRTLTGKTTIIPVISKADTITTKHMAMLKRGVAESLKKANLDPLAPLGLEDEGSDSSRLDEADEDDSTDSNSGSRPNGHKESPAGSISGSLQNSTEELPFLPLSIISPDLYEPGVVGRQFPWGFADPYNEEHCDFTRLKEAVFAEWRGDLRELSRERWYEGWRTSRLNRRNQSARR